MPVDDVVTGATTEGIPVAPSMGAALEVARVPPERALVDGRVVFISVLAVVIALAAGVVAQLLTRLIWLVTNVAFYRRFSVDYATPAGHHLGGWVVLVPVLGGVVVGLMARYGSAAIRGHGIPEAMEQVLLKGSRIPARVTLLKPLSAAVAIGTGGPFGAEGPIIATGGALGSLLGQLLRTTAAERKTLLAAGAAAGMAATFGSPVSAVLLAVELLLFELRPRSVIPVAFAAATATGVRIAFVGASPAFSMPNLVHRREPRSPPTWRSARSSAFSRCWSPERSTPWRMPSSICPSTGCGGRRSGRSRWGWSVTSRRARWASGTTTSTTSSPATSPCKPCSCSARSSSSPGASRWGAAPPAARSRRSSPSEVGSEGRWRRERQRRPRTSGSTSASGRWWEWPPCSPGPRARCSLRSSSPSRPPASRWGFCHCSAAAAARSSSPACSCATRS